jgi:hypothetical protein
MSQQLLPWKLRRSDFDTPGWHTRPTVGFELMFEFLRLSPSYELARREASGNLVDDDRVSLPSDFDQVRQTYKLLGDVQNTLFRQWWLNHGLMAFGVPHARPKPRGLAVLEASVDTQPDALTETLSQYLSSTRRDEGLLFVLVLAVPLAARRSEVLTEVRKLLDQHEMGEQLLPKPQFRLMGQRLRAKVLFNGVRLLWFRAAKPKWELWRLGAKAGLSSTYSSVLDVNAPRKVKDVFEMHDREMMSKITFRALTKFEAIAENAARGRFPCEEPVDKAPFDYPALSRIVRTKNRWEDKEKARLMRAYSTSTAQPRSKDVDL